MRVQGGPSEREARGPLISREAAGPGGTFSLSVVGFAAVSAFIVLSLDERGIGHGAAVFSVFAGTVVATRFVGGSLPDRIGPARCAIGAGLIECVGLVLLGAAESLPVAILGAMGMGAAFSLLFPSLSLIAVSRRLRRASSALNCWIVGEFSTSGRAGTVCPSEASSAVASRATDPASCARSRASSRFSPAICWESKVVPFDLETPDFSRNDVAACSERSSSLRRLTRRVPSQSLTRRVADVCTST